MNSDADTARETVRLRQAFAALSRDAVPAEDCPPAERLWDAARGLAEPGAGGVRELIEHLATCGACAETWRLARELEPAASAAEVRPASPPWWRQSVWTVAAAALVVLVLGLSWRQPADRPADTVRGAAPEQILRIPADGGRLSRRDPVLRWQASENATYDLLVMTEDMDETLVEVYDLEFAEYRIPAEKLRRVRVGAVLYWYVEVKTPQGSSELPTSSLVLEP